jgi:cytidylate kinase
MHLIGQTLERSTDMAVITISRGSYSRGKEIAEKAARKLGYGCISRDVLLDASEQFSIPEFKLVGAIHDAPSILDRFTFGKEKYIAYIQAALLNALRDDDMVYHGLAGHFFLKDISHVLKVRIIADIEDRVRFVMERDKVSSKEARRVLKHDDEQRRKWGLSLYGIDTSDSSLYDLVIHIKKITVDSAVDLICHAVKLPPFHTTEQSRKTMLDKTLAAQVKAALIDYTPKVEVSSDDGRIWVMIKDRPERVEATDVKALVRTVRGVKEVEVQVVPMSLYSS